MTTVAMQNNDGKKAFSVLVMNTLAFTVCFAVWTMNGVLVTYLVDNGVFSWSKTEIGWLFGIPVLTGSVLRLPVGVLTDRFGGKYVYIGVMLLSALAAYLMSYAQGFAGFVWGSLGFGIAGAAFAVGIAYTSVWFPKERQGTVLGIFGAGNAGAALTSMGAPVLLGWLTDNSLEVGNWRLLPRFYALALLMMSVLFYFFTYNRIPDKSQGKTLTERLAPLKDVRVWRFGLYYFYVFGGFVALAQWLIPYYVNVYAVSLVAAGLLASIYSLPSGVIRALGGWLSDIYGARRMMSWVFLWCLACTVLLIVPRMDINSPGNGVMAAASGTVTEITDTALKVGSRAYPFSPRRSIIPGAIAGQDESLLVWPTFEFWQEPVVSIGEVVKRKQLLARGTTHIYFQANIWIFTGLLLIVGLWMGFGKAAVYKYIPDYFPGDVGVVGGIVGVIGGLGGFFCPIIFGYLLDATGIWTTCWMFFAVLIAVSLFWMHTVVQRLMLNRAPQLMQKMEDGEDDTNTRPLKMA